MSHWKVRVFSEHVAEGDRATYVSEVWCNSLDGLTFSTADPEFGIKPMRFHSRKAAESIRVALSNCEEFQDCAFEVRRFKADP